MQQEKRLDEFTGAADDTGKLPVCGDYLALGSNMAYRIIGCIEEENYRYSLTTETDASTKRSLVVVQCNPSRASSTRSDPTVGKVSLWAEENGFRLVSFFNLFARRSPNVEEIRQLPYSRLVGPKNNAMLAERPSAKDITVFAWGGDLPVSNDLYERRLEEINLIFAGRAIFRVGALVRGRYPRHGRLWNHGNRSIHSLSWAELLPNYSLKRTDAGQLR